MTTANCPKCGAALPANSPEGLCPKCLLQAGLQSEIDAPGTAETNPSPPAQHGFVPPRAAELGEHFPQLEILELIGRGGMGAVYKARQRELDRLVALKILPPEVGGDPAFAERFSREARALAKLSHANIVAVFDSGKANDLYYFVMEYIDGVNLRQAMQAGKLTPEEAVAIVPQICDALQYAHDEGIVHRDIKPENVLVDNKGRVKIADFGLAKLLGREPTDLTLTQTQQVMGTPRYMAPEQMTASANVDHRADIYSLGVVFYELLTGEVPMGRFDPPSKRVQVDVRLDEIVLRTLEREPAQRYQRASELKTDVETVTSSPQLQSSEPQRTHARNSPTSDDDRERARREVKIPAIGLIIVGILTVLASPLFPVAPASLISFWTVVRMEPMEKEPAKELMNEGPTGRGQELPLIERGQPLPIDDSGAEPVSPIRDQLRQDTADTVETANASDSEASAYESHAQGPVDSQFESAPPARGPNWIAVSIGLLLLIIFFALPVLIVGVLMIVGGWRMMALTSYGLAVTASIFALLPCQPLFFLGLIFGIWSLVVLSRPHVKGAFGPRQGGEASASGASPAVAIPEKDVSNHRSRSNQFQLAADLLSVAAASALFVAVGVAAWIIFAQRGNFWHNTIFTLWGMSGTLAVYALFIGGSAMLMRRRRARLAVLLIIALFGVLAPGALALNVIMEEVPQWPVLLPMWLALPVCAWTCFLLLTSPYAQAGSGGPVDVRGNRRRLLVIAAAAAFALFVGDGVAFYVAKTSSARDEILHAANEGDAARVRQLLRWCNDYQAQGQALEIAAGGGHTDVIKLLLEAGAPIESTDNLGETPLMDAAYNGHVDAVEALIRHGANARATDHRGNNILYWAIRSGRASVVEIILPRVDTPDDIRLKDDKGQPMILLAAHYGDERMVGLLLSFGAAVDDRDASGRTPLMQAADKGKIEVAKVLMGQGADLEARDARGETALIKAAYAGQTSTVALLLDNKADVNGKDNLGHTALTWAAARDHQLVIDKLLERGAKEDGIYQLWKGFKMAVTGDYAGAVPVLQQAQQQLRLYMGRRVIQVGTLRIITNNPKSFAQMALGECMILAGAEEADRPYRDVRDQLKGHNLDLFTVIELSPEAKATGEFDNNNYVSTEFTLDSRALDQALAEPLSPVRLRFDRTSVTTVHNSTGGTRNETGGTGTANGIFAELDRQ